MSLFASLRPGPNEGRMRVRDASMGAKPRLLGVGFAGPDAADSSTLHVVCRPLAKRNMVLDKTMNVQAGHFMHFDDHYGGRKDGGNCAKIKKRSILVVAIQGVA